MPTTGKTCSSCGAQGQEGAFCDECGQTLSETTSRPVEPAAVASPAPAFIPAPSAAVPPPEPPTRLDAFPPIAASGDNPAAATQPQGTDTWEMPVKPPNSGDQPVPAPRASVPAADPAEQARALLVPVDEPSAPAASPAAPVLPGRPEPVMPASVRLQEAEESTEGGRRCPWCGTPNPVDRHFCRRCAMSLDEKPGEGPARPTWWRRLLDWRNRPIPYAGQRPRLRRGPGQLARLLMTLAIVALVIVLASIWGGSAVEAIEDHFISPNFQTIKTITVSAEAPGHPASNLDDTYNNTWWGSEGSDPGTTLDVTLRSPVTLLDVVITPGAGVSPQDYAQQDAPKSMTMVMTSENGTQTTQQISLPNSPGYQVRAVHGNDITKIHFVINSFYQGSAPDAQIAIAEIEFFGR